jgi:hypothetical protein
MCLDKLKRLTGASGMVALPGGMLSTRTKYLPACTKTKILRTTLVVVSSGKSPNVVREKLSPIVFWISLKRRKMKKKRGVENPRD